MLYLDQISLKYVKDWINDKPTHVQIMGWYQKSDVPLSNLLMA